MSVRRLYLGCTDEFRLTVSFSEEDRVDVLHDVAGDFEEVALVLEGIRARRAPLSIATW